MSQVEERTERAKDDLGPGSGWQNEESACLGVCR